MTWAVIATASPSGSPAAALIGIALMGQAQDIRVIFDTLTTTCKYARIKANPRVALVIGLGEETTLQLDGEAEELAGEALAEAKAAYFRKWPDGRAREATAISAGNLRRSSSCATSRPTASNDPSRHAREPGEQAAPGRAH
jgi:hypothetical protein